MNKLQFTCGQSIIQILSLSQLFLDYNNKQQIWIHNSRTSMFKKLYIIVLVFLLIQLSYTIVDRTYYKYLGLKIAATTEQIEQAYQQKLHKISTEDNQQQQKRKLPLLELAYKTLVNPQQRQKYQRYGKDYAKNNIKEITSTNPYSGNDYRKGAPMNMKIPVSIEDLYNGTTVKALFQTTEACEKCMGTGADSLKSLRNCGTCGGKGFSFVQGRNMHGQPQQFEGICPQCQGTGKLVTKQCSACQGTKIVNKVKVIEIKIPAKFQGKQLRMKNYGPQQSLGAPSDFLLQIQQIPSKLWKRSGDNLFFRLQITLQEAIFGFRKAIKHLSGEQIVVERSQITTKQTKLSFPGKGFTNNGRLTVEFKISIPNFTDKQLNMWEDFFQKYNI